MGSRTLLLLVLFASSCTFAQEDGTESQNSRCSRDATKFKHFKKYVYNYEAGTSSGVTGTADAQSGSSFNCKVELEVPQPCNFILRISQCTLREVFGVDSEGRSLFKKAKNSEDFANAMSKYEVNFSVIEGKQVILYPNNEDPGNILNMKRGIISSLLVPDETKEISNMDTAYGECSSQITVTDRKGAVATDITIKRNLKTCNQFTPLRDYVSPIALFKGMNAPLSTLLSSSQSCQYTLEPKMRHVREASCVETHLFLPFSHKNQYGMMAKVTQTLKLESVSKTNNREFTVSPPGTGLALEAVEHLSTNEDDVLDSLMELQKMSTSQQNQQRANLFHKLVTALRALNNETLGPLVPRLVQLSSPIALQALTQCGTPECFGGILQVLRTGNISPVLTDTVTYALGLLSSPCTKRVRELLNMAQYQQSRASFYALSHAVTNFYEDRKTITPELRDVADFMSSLLENECTGDQDKTFLTLKAIGIMGNVLEEANPQVKAAVLKCARGQETSLDVQKAAVQALRKMSMTDEVRSVLVQAFQNNNSPVQKRLAAYLILMRGPSSSDLRKVVRTLKKDDSDQVKNFVASHIVNILNSQEPETQELKGKVEESLKSSGVPAIVSDFTKFSRNYQISKTLDVPGLSDKLGAKEIGAKVEGNIIYDSTGYMPKEAMLEATLNMFGQSVDMFGVNIEGKNFETTLDALFGKGGFFPDCATKALYWVDGKVPDKVAEVLYKWFGVSRQDNQNQDLKKAFLMNVEKLIKEVKSSDAPEAKAYLEILGKELGYLKLSDFKMMGNMLLKSFQSTQQLPAQIMQTFSNGGESDLFAHYIFLDNQFYLPTGSGLQLQVSLSGIITPGTKSGIKFGMKNMKAELSLKPAVAVEFVTNLGIQIPKFSKHAVQMNTNIYHESGVQARASLSYGQFKFSIPAPTMPTKLFSINNKVNLVFASKTEVMASIMENRKEQSYCKRLITGLEYCTNIAYSNASSIDAAPYFPLTGEARFELEIQPTGEVQEYSLTANYNLNREGSDQVATLKVSAQAEGAKSPEASLTVKYNRNKFILTSDVEIPEANVNFGASLRLNDESSDFRRSFALVAELSNQQISEATLTGRLSYDGSTEAVLSGGLSIPRLHVEANAEANLMKVLSDYKLQLQSSATICALSGSQRLVFTYDSDKVELEWKTASNSNVKKIISKLPDVRFSDLSDYPDTIRGYANDILDHKVAHTDMTVRHISSQSIVATKKWLQQVSHNSPYVETLSNKLTAFKEGLSFPDDLFLNSDGRIRYQFNKDSISINIPLPFGGKLSHEVVPNIWSPPLELESVGLRVPSKEFKIPAFTIPEYYQLKVPLIGYLDLSSNINSNYYNWSASYTGGNTSSNAQQQFSSRYQMRADSSLEILSYNIEGSAMSSYDPMNTLTVSIEKSLHHTLLDASMRINELYNFKSSQWYKGSGSYQARSILGLELSGAASVRSSINNNILTVEGEGNDRFTLASFFANQDLLLVGTFNTETGQKKLESNYKFDSSFLKATNKMSGMFLTEATTITSTTDFQDGALINAMTLDHRNGELSLKCDTNGNYNNLVGLNKFEVMLSSARAAVRSEYQATYKRNRFYTLLTGSLNNVGLELNSDITFNNQGSRSAHKGTLKINMDGLTTSATTSVNYSPFVLESELNAAIGLSGAAMKMTANTRCREHNAKISVDGRASLSELYLSSVHHVALYSMDSTHLLSFKVNPEGLKFTNNLMGSFDKIKLEISNDLSIAGYNLQLTSKFENSFSPDRFHKHRFDFQMQPYTMTALLNNELQYGALELTNRGQVQLEAFKMNFNGNVRGAFNKDEIKHSYGFTIGKMEANLNTDTVANIQGTAHTHRFAVDIAGFSASLTSNTNSESKSMRFTNRIRSVVEPFTITIDSQTNGDGRLMIFGEQTGQLYSKFILKAEPLAFNLVHDYRGSTSHSFGKGKVHETLVDYKITVLFTPAEQLSSWKLKSRLNQNTYNQDISAYNNADSIGVEVSGQTLADLSILDREVHLPFVRFNPIDSLNLRDSVNSPQEFGISGYIKYDKNKDMHVISLPFIENMSLYFEKIRTALLTTLQALQNSLKDINIDQYVERYKRALDTASQKVNDYVNNLDIESKVSVARERMISLSKEFKITAEELQAAIENNFRWVELNLQNYLNEVNRYARENFDLDQLMKSAEKLIQICIEKLKALDKEYRVREKTLEMIQNIQILIEKINVNELGQSLSAWIQNVDDLYQIKANLKRLLQEIQNYIQRIDIDQITQNVKELLQSIEISKYRDMIKNALPFENIRFIIEQVKNLILTQLEELEVSEKINAVIDKLQDIVATYDIDKKIEVLIEKFAEFLNHQRVRETIETVINMLSDIDIKLHYKKVLAFVDAKVKQVRDYDFQKLIDDVNYYLDMIVKKMRSFNYEKFVDDFNNWIREMTEEINKKLRALELPQKAEALRQYLNNIRSVAAEYLQQVRDTRIAAIMQWYEDIMSSTVLIEWKKRTIEHLEDVRDRIYSMNIKEEFQRYLKQVSQAYSRLVMFITDQWSFLAGKITRFAEENNIQEWAEKVKVFVEEGFVVPEIKLGYISIPAFEVSLRTLRDATFRTPSFNVPFTDLWVQSVEINFRKLKNIEIPTRFVTPEFTLLNIYRVPSYTIDLNDIKLKIVRIIDQIISSDYKWPSSDVLLRDLQMSDMGLPEFTIPEISLPNMQLPEYKIPKLNLENFQFPDIQIPEFQLPKIPHTVSIPTFGKFSSSFKVTSPFFTMLTSSEVNNVTVSAKTPEMVASLTAEATSMVEALAFTFRADSRISAPLMEQLVLKETVLLSNKHVKLDHFSEVAFTSSHIQTQVQTKVNFKTEKNSADLENSIILKVEKRITADVNTKYSHRLNIPQFDFSSQLDLQNDIDTTVDIGRISVTSSGKGNWNWACPLFSHDGTHQADLKFNLRGGSIEVSGTNKIIDKYLKLDQSLKYNSVFLNSLTIEAISKAESPSIGNSIATVKGSIQVNDMKIALQATHNTELLGRATGTINNNFEFLTRPFEIKLVTANNGNLKISFPMELTGKIEFLNNYDFILDPNIQQVLWKANGRFNQYKVSHTISLTNNEENIAAGLAMNGEANLDFLTIPVSIPEIQIPYTSMKTPQVREFSLWERSGLKNLLTTTRQNIDLNIKLQYQKNKDMHAIPLPLEKLFDSINTNMKTLNQKFEVGRDKTLNVLMDSYNQAKVKIDKYRVDNQVNKIPRTFRIPGYKIPFVNIEVSSFSAELPAFGYIVPKEISTPSFVVPVIGFSIPSYKLVLPSPELPVLHVPNSLRRLSLPRIKLPSGQSSIFIPAMGNLTYDFFFKSNVISLTTSAGIYNQSDISARVSVASTSVLDALAFNIDGTTGLTRKRGLKLATALALKTAFGEGKHESSISFGKKNVEASVITNAKMDTQILKSTFKQELTGNTKTKPTVTSKMTLSYDLIVPYGNTAKGQLDHTLNLEGLTSYFSLETRTIGDLRGTLLTRQPFYARFTSDANTYMNSNNLRSSVKLVSNSGAEGLGTVDFTENLAIETSTSRIYTVWEHKGENNLIFGPFFTSRGQQSGKATLELALWSLLADLKVQVNQPNFFIESLNQDISLNVKGEKQEFSMKGNGVIESLILAHNIQLSNDQTDAKLDFGGSVQGNVDFLKSIILPVYEKSLWDILKFDVTTRADQKQYLNASTTVIYTKNNNGFFYPFPSESLGDGYTMTFPGMTLSNAMHLPLSLPEVKFPATYINLLYTAERDSSIPFIELSIPQYQVTMSKYTLPKSFYNFDLNSLFNKIADIDLPTIEIPPQSVVFPPVKLRLPAGIYIPAFGSLSGSVKFTTPIYNLTWTNKLANNPDAFVGSVDATSSSTLRFLEFDLDASVGSLLNGRDLIVLGQGSLSHVDLSANWKHEATFTGLRMANHKLELGIISPTFTDVQISCKHDSNGISSSISSPSTGMLGLVVEKDAKTIKMKVYSRSLASPGKDTLILKNEISLKMAERLQNKLNWREDAAQDVLNGLKERLPKMSDSIYNCVNKYHREHLGMDMKEANLKMKELLHSRVSSTYRSASNQIDQMKYQLQSAARGASRNYADAFNKAQQWYQEPADMSFLLSDGEMGAKVYDKFITVIRGYHNAVRDVIDAAITFLKSTRFQLPSQQRSYTGEELFAMFMKSTTYIIDENMKQIQQLLDSVIQSLNNANFNIPGTNTNIEGRQVILAIKDILKEIQQIVNKLFIDIQNLSLEKYLQQLKTLTREASLKMEKLTEALKSRNYQDMKAQAQQMYSDAVNSKYVQYLSDNAARIEKSADQLLKLYRTVYEELSEKLKQLLIYAKALREEYLDPNVVGWSVKYYEIEEKVLELFQVIINALKELPAKYGINISEHADNLKKLLKGYYEQAKVLATNVEGRGLEQVRKISLKIDEKVSDWSNAAKTAALEHSQLINTKLHEAYVQLLNSYEKFFIEANNLIDLVIEKYNSLVEFITQMLQNFQNSASEEMKTYISTQKGELKVEVPHPFNWDSFDEIPQVRSDIIAKRMEIARSMVLDGVDKGSKKWEELQSFIEKQLEDGKVSAQQIIDNIRHWKKN
ncbi:LOW QUALITY PROTEIN: apolipoprotein B-100 [Pseudophryne corroboree]|uniref:LOW QUALITY PROTEIN: apolipoprotein B-100 n=1 Tax=Pseudophryne corroboree TaxID=495146 RepID=UPI003081C47A